MYTHQQESSQANPRPLAFFYEKDAWINPQVAASKPARGQLWSSQMAKKWLSDQLVKPTHAHKKSLKLLFLRDLKWSHLSESN